MPPTLASVYLKAREERRIIAGHLWVYSNEIDVSRSSLKNFTNGELVKIMTKQDTPLGIGYINPQTLLCIRLLTRNVDEKIDENFFFKRLQQAFSLRNRLFKTPYYRLCYGESDLLPGLIIDRFADYYVCQINTAGMEKLITPLITALIQLAKPHGILLKNNTPSCQLEALENYQNIIYGEIPEELVIEENGVRFYVNLLKGQKTGWYYDQRDNRLRLQRYCENKSVLDVYSFSGSFAMYAAKFNAAHITCIESSASACKLIAKNAELNNCSYKISILHEDAETAMETLIARQKKYDLVLLDPPAFIKKRKEINLGLKKYLRVNKLAAQLVKNAGVLVTSSCSMHLTSEELLRTLRSAAIPFHPQIQILEYGLQSCDHPVHPLIPETSYLKSIFSHLYNV